MWGKNCREKVSLGGRISVWTKLLKYGFSGKSQKRREGINRKKLLLLFLAEFGECYKQTSDIKDGEIKLLAKSLPYVVRKGRAVSTVQKYKAGWDGWVRWSGAKDEVETRPAEPFYVAIYLNHLFFLNGNKGSVNAAFYGIRWGHHIVGLDSPTDNP